MPRLYIEVEVGIDIGRLRLVGKNGNAELLSGAQGGVVFMDDLAPVIPLFEHDALRLHGKLSLIHISFRCVRRYFFDC